MKQDLKIEDILRSDFMIADQFNYKDFTFQRRVKDGIWYVCFQNQIVNWGQYETELKQWVDKHYILLKF